MFHQSTYRTRRAKLLAQLKDRNVETGFIVLLANGESPRNYPDNCYEFRQDSTWLYFIGLREPGMAALINIAGGETTLFGTELTVHDMVWTGPRPSLEELAALGGISQTASIDKLAEHIGQAARYGRIHYLKPYRVDTAQSFSRFLGMPLEQVGIGASLELTKAVIALREVKEDEEIGELDAASAVSAEMHQAVLSSLHPGWRAWEAASLARYVAESRGFSLSFPSIATTHGEILHNHDYGAVCEDGQLFLLDAGAESENGYAGDLTTTFPVGRQFTARQKEIYTILLAMMEASIKKTGPGVRFLDVHLAAAQALAQGLVDLGLYEGEPDEIVALGAHALLFPHGVGHMIGLDVHDMENLGEDLVGYDGQPRSSQFGLRSLRLAKTLKPGMAHTIEPGIYFIPGLFELWRSEKKFKHLIRYDRLAAWIGAGGMRIEEDWLVTDTGARRLGPLLDKGIGAIEAQRRVMH